MTERYSWRPTTAEATQYADYDWQLCESIHPVVYMEQDGELLRLPLRINRLPHLRLFRGWIRDGATADERRSAHKLLELMNRGWWARHPEYWIRTTTDAGVPYVTQNLGSVVGDRLIEDMLEKFVDLSETSTPVA